MFEASKDFKDLANNLMHFKSLNSSRKRSILKSLSLEVIIVKYFNQNKIESLNFVLGVF